MRSGLRKTPANRQSLYFLHHFPEWDVSLLWTVSKRPVIEVIVFFGCDRGIAAKPEVFYFQWYGDAISSDNT
jgi:hypothetical protein